MPRILLSLRCSTHSARPVVTCLAARGTSVWSLRMVLSLDCNGFADAWSSPAVLQINCCRATLGETIESCFNLMLGIGVSLLYDFVVLAYLPNHWLTIAVAIVVFTFTMSLSRLPAVAVKVRSRDGDPFRGQYIYPLGVFASECGAVSGGRVDGGRYPIGASYFFSPRVLLSSQRVMTQKACGVPRTSVCLVLGNSSATQCVH